MATASAVMALGLFCRAGGMAMLWARSRAARAEKVLEAMLAVLYKSRLFYSDDESREAKSSD